jgi:ADP-ribose pyrophosphatase YjhB (NUDIX family)
MEDQWLSWAKKLQALGSTGAFFSTSEFDAERYQEITDIANAMLASLGRVPIERIAELIPDYAQGYVTPKIDVRAAIVRGSQVLLVQEKTDQLWTLPGGYADVGISAAANAEKEVREEACLNVVAKRLYGVFHKAKHEYAEDSRDFYKLYFLCQEADTTVIPAPGLETMDARFFERHDLPALSEGRVIEKHLQLAFEYVANPTRPVFVD